MRTLTVLLVAIAACGLERNPPGPGGGNGGTRDGGGDGSFGDGGDPTQLPGRLCGVTDMRQPTACEMRLARAGVDLAIGEDEVLSDEFGLFVLPRPSSSTAVVRAAWSDTAVVQTAVEVDTSSEEIDIPAALQINWESFTAVLGAPEPDGTATIALYLLDEGGEPIESADIITPGGTVTAPYYDGATQQDWIQGGATGSFGVVLLFGVPVAGDTIDISVNTPGGGKTASAVPIFPDTLTFATRVLP